MSQANSATATRLKQAIRDEASRLGFTLAGFTSPDPPAHLSAFEQWVAHGRHANMTYMADAESRARRAHPRRIMPDCKSVLVLAAPYSNPSRGGRPDPPDSCEISGQIAAYAWGTDYHAVFPGRLKALMTFIEDYLGHAVGSRCYTDTGPILERDLAQRAGLGWIGRNTCLINPHHGSYFLLAEIMLDVEIEPDPPFETDRCGSCRRCIDACPTDCILPDRTLDSGRCISYLTIELRDEIPVELRPKIGNWVFGCDLCQMVCPWNRFSAADGNEAFRPRPSVPRPDLVRELSLTPEGFSRKFERSAVKRSRRSGYLRNVAIALGNSLDAVSLPVLKQASRHPDRLVSTHASWAIQRIEAQDDGPA